MSYLLIHQTANRLLKNIYEKYCNRLYRLREKTIIYIIYIYIYIYISIYIYIYIYIYLYIYIDKYTFLNNILKINLYYDVVQKEKIQLITNVLLN